MKQIEDIKVFGDGAVFHHVGIAVRSIDDTVRGLPKVTDTVQKVRVAVTSINDLPVELVEPVAEDSPVTRILKKGESLYHLCYRVPNIDFAIEAGRKHGFHCIATPVPAVAFGNKRIAWLYSKNLGLFELLEEPDS